MTGTADYFDSWKHTKNVELFKLIVPMSRRVRRRIAQKIHNQFVNEAILLVDVSLINLAIIGSRSD